MEGTSSQVPGTPCGMASSCAVLKGQLSLPGDILGSSPRHVGQATCLLSLCSVPASGKRLQMLPRLLFVPRQLRPLAMIQMFAQMFTY